jgi:hypothetical protein
MEEAVVVTLEAWSIEMPRDEPTPWEVPKLTVSRVPLLFEEDALELMLVELSAFCDVLAPLSMLALISEELLVLCCPETPKLVLTPPLPVPAPPLLPPPPLPLRASDVELAVVAKVLLSLTFPEWDSLAD